MSSVRGDSDDKIVIDTMTLPGPVCAPSVASIRPEEPVVVRAKGTRQQMPLMRPDDVTATGSVSRSVADAIADAPGTPSARTVAGARDPSPDPLPAARDPVEVLRMWPVSSLEHGNAPARPRATLRASSLGPQLHDKIRLAHLALDLYRELEELQATTCGAAAERRARVDDCDDPRCQERANTLRGGLIEACLLVQRVALMAPVAGTKAALDDKVRDLLALLDH